MANYSIQITKQGRKGSVQAFLLEDGIQIARIVRAASINGFINEPSFTFFTSNAEIRFESFCDSISKEECVEALGFPF